MPEGGKTLQHWSQAAAVEGKQLAVGKGAPKLFSSHCVNPLIVINSEWALLLYCDF